MCSEYQNMVASFGKALQMDMSKLPEMGKTWIVLGYFDTLQTYPLPLNEGGNWLNAMWRHNIELTQKLDGQFYFHPLHMMTNIPQDQEAVYKSFWESNSPYLFLSLVQKVAQETAGTKAITDELALAPEGVDCVYYHTMELSDLIVAWKSNSLAALLEELKRLYHSPHVGDMDTFVAIDYHFLQKRKWTEPPLLEPDQGKSIYASTRCVVRDIEQKCKYLEYLNAIPAFSAASTNFSTGIEDLHVTYSQIPVHDFLEVLHKTLFDPETKKAFSAAFSECATQLGLSAGNTPVSVRNQSELTERCEDLLVRFLEATGGIQEHNSRRDISWIKPAGNLYNALLDMSRNCVLDGFCYLILDAAEAFCEGVEQWSLSHRKPMPSHQLERVQRFIRGWGSLMEQATRADGRFMQMPGFSPALCEIPARLLEFYLAFANRCANVMAQDVESDEEVALLFVPKICRKMKVESIFDLPMKNGTKHLLYVDIPLDMLYDPLSVLCCLCHEVSHFVGKNWRNRPLRKGELIYVAANELSQQLGMSNQEIVPLIYRDLQRLCANERDYFQPLLLALKEAGKTAVADDIKYNQWYQRAVDLIDSSPSFEQKNLFQIELISRRRTLLAEYSDFEWLLDNLGYLFRECYADVAMIYLLQPGRSAYLRLAQQELEEMGTEVENIREDPRYSVIVQRWAAILLLDKLWEGQPDADLDIWIRQKKSGEMGDFVKDIEAVCSLAAWENNNGTLYNTSESFIHLLSYLTQCCETIEAACQGKPELAGLRQIFDQMARTYTLDCSRCEALISESRNVLVSSGSTPAVSPAP